MGTTREESTLVPSRGPPVPLVLEDFNPGGGSPFSTLVRSLSTVSNHHKERGSGLLSPLSPSPEGENRPHDGGGLGLVL